MLGYRWIAARWGEVEEGEGRNESMASPGRMASSGSSSRPRRDSISSTWSTTSGVSVRTRDGTTPRRW